MASTKDENENEIVYDFFPLLRIYKDGKVERFAPKLPASVDPSTGVQSKDVIISPETNNSARLYIPKITNPLQKLPLLVYFHGGGFVAESASSPMYHTHLNILVSQANIIAVSVDYRLAPEHHLPVAYDDCWEALNWIFSGCPNDSWLNDYADFQRVFFAGDSAGANISHNLAIRIGQGLLDGVKFNLAGIILVHPYFGGVEPVGAEGDHMDKKTFSDKLWAFVNPESSGSDDPLFNPILDPNLKSLGCSRVLVSVAEKDILRDRGRIYHEVLGKSGWGGEVEFMDVKGEDHVFHLFNPTCDNAVALLDRMASFINKDKE